MNRQHHACVARQRGAATLVVVMMLFLVMALLAAYSNRSMLFEQRIASSYFRASLSQEVAEAGVEWTLAQLNGTEVDGACKPVNDGGRFVDRYLVLDQTDRHIASRIPELQTRIIDCARDIASEGWACRCPAANTAHTARTPAAAGGQLVPSFDVRFSPGTRGGTLDVRVTGCTDSVNDSCIQDSAGVSLAQHGVSSLKVLVGLVSAVRSPPASPLVVRTGIISTGTGSLGLHNTDPRSAGMLASMGGTWTGKGSSRLESVPGSPTALAVLENDDDINARPEDAEGLFKMFMGASRSRYAQHPALRRVTCAGDCAATLQDAYAAGQRMVWVEGPMTISSNKVLGDLTDPLLIVANGDVTLTGQFELNGMLVATGNLAWINNTALLSRVNGIVLVGGAMTTAGAGRMDIVYQQAIADQLRNRMGSYVRVPGGWIDQD